MRKPVEQRSDVRAERRAKPCIKHGELDGYFDWFRISSGDVFAFVDVETGSAAGEPD